MKNLTKLGFNVDWDEMDEVDFEINQVIANEFLRLESKAISKANKK